ncbi:Methyl-CpG-binding domain-containing protein [Actinidia chinensis var. chinensis]|uniref:Methyl-CpG-binding domain-containing protein n=1 Tax=Actinidia chinensis var. chinensis TaxID=1590841 RepID=A0A2R6RE64_ACTCC|nr:Methyl-CpG-binding domain-containing protein [Actinidia chinensis var. chinensis]
MHFVCRMHPVRDISILGHSLNAPMTTSNMLYLENGFNLLKASRGVAQIPKSGFEDIMQHMLGKASKEADLGSTLSGALRPSHCTPLNFLPQRQSELYLQALREYIHEKQGLLGDGWHVDFIFCKDRCKTFAVYCAPDGSRFESMSNVAGHLGLLTNYCFLETEDRSDGRAAQLKGLYSESGGKEFSRFSKANKHMENQNTPRSSSFAGIPSGIGMLGHQTAKFESSRSTAEANSMDHGHCGPWLRQDVCPLQFEDFMVLSLGKVDRRPSYHNTTRIWPVGYRSYWHDKITGSIFVSEVVDGGDAGPNFKVQRYPCSAQPIPISTTVLFRKNSESYGRPDKVANDDSTTSVMDDDENLSIKLMLTEDSPPHMEDIDFQKVNNSTRESSCFPQRYVHITPDDLGLGDCIGEFSVEGGSSSLVWEKASGTLLRTCYEVHKQIGRLQFRCKHNVNGVNAKAAENVDSLSKYSYLSGPTGVPHLVQSNNELHTFGEMMMKWLRQDRFGLDEEFVQELLEQLPGVHACSEYKFLNKRIQNSGSQTVRSGFLLVRRKRNVQSGRVADGFLLSCKRPQRQLVEDSEVNKSFPVGKPMSAKLPAYLIGDVLQAWEFLWRFSEVLGLEEAFSFQELETELMNPWLETINPLEGAGNEIKNCRDFTLCTGSALRKAHSSLLNVVVGELLLKVARYVDPNSDAEECKLRRGRRKDADNSIASKKLKFDMLQINELTWPELARRYILVILSMEGKLDSGEITCRESSKIFHCLQGDGGTLCGSLTGVAGMEADAKFLAEASKQVFGSVKKKSDFVCTDQVKSDAMSNPKMIEVNGIEVPEWVQVLEPVRKLPTNVGARIRKCVHEALLKNPPEWAKKIMEHSISKEVYKGNASGPTKRAIVSLLADVGQKNLEPKPEKKEKVKRVNTISDLIMKQCRIVLRRIAAEDEERVFFNLLGRTLVNVNDNDDEGLLGYPAMVSRPLDFRTIDIRLFAGAYGGSHEAFLEDVREVWNNIRTAYADQSDLIDLAESLSTKFEVMYEKEVQEFAESAKSLSSNDESKPEIADMLMHANKSSIPKAPWDEGVCKVCGVDKDDDNVLLCDKCDSEYHTYCLSPPLARIPEGNWYCPSCVAGQFKSQGASHGTRVNWCRKKRYQGDFTRNFMETLSGLSRTLGSKEYWDFNVEERVLLLKFLCDETLNSSILRDHLDQCAHMSADLQHKLRFLSSEWNNLKCREEILAANLEKANAVHNRVGELAPDVLAYVLNTEGKLIGKLPNWQDELTPSHPQQQKNGTRGENAWNPLGAHQGLKDGITGRTHMAEYLSLVHVNAEHLLNGHHSTFQSDASVLPENDLEMSSLKQELSLLQDSIASLEAELQKVSLRKEILGRDSTGRAYWCFDRADISSVMMVNGSVGEEQNKFSEHGGPYNSNLRTSHYGLENPSSSRGPRMSSMCQYAQNNGTATSAWVSYQSDKEIREVLRWLRDGDARERELKESILHWQRNNLKDSNNAEKNIQNEKQADCSKLSNGAKAADPTFLVTKAVTALENKYGPCFGSDDTDISKERGQKGKVTCEGRMCRCECLEPNWPSRHHCLLCHRTFSTSEELEKHNDGKCNEGSVITKNKKVNEDSLKGKKMATEASVKKHPDDNGISKASKNEKNEIGFEASKFQDPECPYDFKEISTKFVTQNSLRELVRDVGLIGSSGTPTFVPSESPYLSDPTLRLVPTKKNEVNSGNESTNVENQSINRTQIEVGMDFDSGSSNFPKYFGNDRDEKISKVERLIYNSTNERDQWSSIKNRSIAVRVGNSFAVPESSSRRLVGRVSLILKQLKINLLDMDAALPEEALRPSISNFKKRSAWRTFVKSAGSVYEMVQATIILENMIKSDYLKKNWWYWSSLSVAANVSTLSALALRVYTLDAAIKFEKPSPISDSTGIRKSGEEEEGTPPKLDTINNTKESSPQIQKTHNDPTDSSKPKTRLNKRRKDLGG